MIILIKVYDLNTPSIIYVLQQQQWYNLNV